ncbi:hypothetical protein NBRC116601_06920 [Cognatishimia sp. WU-CL00825]|uniref:hypothetical protein n=1 Tax=Cognatishimia sp. WU-CL00825 TaxID=3127658 RepID=UPI003105C02C
MFSETAANRIYRLSAWWDLIVTWPFALPFTLGVLWNFGLTPLHGLTSDGALPPLDVHAVLFGNFFGSVVVIWALVRLNWNDTRLGLYDAAGRVLFSVAMINALMSDISLIVWVFLVPEILWAIVQFLALYPLVKQRLA